MKIADRPQTFAPHRQQAPKPPAPDTIQDKVESGPPQPPEHGKLRRAWDAVVRYTEPREETGGNYEKTSYFQALSQGAMEGFYLLGVTGIATGAASAAAGVFVEGKTNKTVGVLAGGAAGAALAAGAAALLGGPVAVGVAALGGALLGSLQTFRGDVSGRVRDTAGGGTMVAGFFMHGPAKMASGIAAACSEKIESKWGKAAVSAGVGLALGASLGALGFAGGSVLACAIGTAAAGAIGPFFGPRFSQTFRNVAQDLGKGLNTLAQKLHIVDKPMDEHKSAAIAAVPAAFLREMLRGGIYSDGSMSKMLIGSSVKAVQLAHMMYFARGHEEQPPKPPEKP